MLLLWLDVSSIAMLYSSHLTAWATAAIATEAVATSGGKITVCSQSCQLTMAAIMVCAGGGGRGWGRVSWQRKSFSSSRKCQQRQWIYYLIHVAANFTIPTAINHCSTLRTPTPDAVVLLSECEMIQLLTIFHFWLRRMCPSCFGSASLRASCQEGGRLLQWSSVKNSWKYQSMICEISWES